MFGFPTHTVIPREWRCVVGFLVFGGLVAGPSSGQDLDSRVEGLLLGSLIGDSAGAPWEFVPPLRSFWTATDTVLTEEGRADLGSRFAIVPSERGQEAYGPWTERLGTLTDDSRFKVIFFDHLDASLGLDREGLARTILEWHAREDGPYDSLRTAWLEEFAFSARWVLGDSGKALPPERAWGGIATMAGQMPFLPVAALHPGDSEAAYLATWDLDFLDNGVARDINAAVVAGLAAALAPGADWASVEVAMRETDPWAFSEVPWVPRQLSRWLDTAADLADEAEGRPAVLYELLEERLGAVTWWEAWVPLVVVFSCARTAEHEPLATMQLILEFGHDTDSYLQLAGAFFGALHGSDAFPQDLRDLVSARLADEYGDSLMRWTALLRLYGN